MPDTTNAADALDAGCRHALATKLRALAWLLSQASLDLEVKDEDLHGLGAIIDECVSALAPVDDAPEMK